MNHHIFCELKETGDEGTFKGIASVYGLEDLGGDVVDKGAFTKTLQENNSVIVLWQHDHREVIGVGEVKEWQGKVMITGKLDLEDPTAQKAYRKMKTGMVKGLSIGFETVKYYWEHLKDQGKSIRHITELKLWEVSVVTFPMLPAAQVTGVKEHDEMKARLERLEQEVLALKASGFEKAAPPAAAAEPTEPVEDHSQAIVSVIDEIRSIIPR